MSNADLMKAIESIRHDWELKEKIKEASEALRQRELEQIHKDLETSRQDAQVLRENAQKEAEEILSKARAEAEDIYNSQVEDIEKKESDFLKEINQREDGIRKKLEEIATKENSAYEESKTRGYEEGYQEGMKQFTDMVESLGKVLEEVRAQRLEVTRQNLQFIHKFARLYAEKIIGPIGAANTRHVLHNIAKALGEVHRATKLKVVVSDRDYDAIEVVKDQFRKLFSPTQKVELLRDGNMAPGGCLLETELGNVDATVESQMALLNQELERDG